MIQEVVYLCDGIQFNMHFFLGGGGDAIPHFHIHIDFNINDLRGFKNSNLQRVLPLHITTTEEEYSAK